MTGLPIVTETLSSKNWTDALQAQNVVITLQSPTLVNDPAPAVTPVDVDTAKLFGTHLREALSVLTGR